MKDVFRKEIEVGDYIIYICSTSDRHFEKAIVLESNETFIRIEYLGIGVSNWRGLKDKGKKSKLTVTERKIIVVNSESSDEKNIYLEGKKRFDEELLKLQKKLARSLEREDKLIVENGILQEEVDKIHYRSDILDL